MKSKDKRTDWYGETFGIDYGVEIDALPPSLLRQLIANPIERFLAIEEIKRKQEEDNKAKERIESMLLSK